MTDHLPNVHQRRAENLRLRKKRKWGRWVLLAVVVLVVAGTWVYQSMTNPVKLRRIAQDYLQQFFSANLSIDRVEFSLFGGIELEGVTLSDPCGNVGAEPLATCRMMTLQHQPFQLLLGRLRFSAIDVSGARCRAVFDDATGHFNVQDLLARNQLGDMGMTNLPRISTGDIQVDVLRRRPKTDELVERLTLNVLALPDPEGTLSYDIVWDASSDRYSSGTLRLDFEKMTLTDVEGGTPWLSVQAAALATEAATPGARYWLDLLGLQGMLQAVDFSLPLLPVVAKGHRVSINIEQAAISVPVDDLERQLPTFERYLTWTNVAGTLQVAHDGALFEFTGMWHNCECKARLRLSGSIDENTSPGDVAFVLSLEANDFPIPRTDPEIAPAESRLIASLPSLAKFYRHYDPHGKIDLALSLSKAEGAESPIVLDGAHIEALGPDISHHKFPYRVTDVRGTVEIGPDGVHVMGLCGKHGDGWVFANGWTGGPAGPMPADLDIYGYDIALDEDLCAGLGPQHRSMWDAFDPEGVTDIHVNMHRGEPENGEPGTWSIRTFAQVHSADATFEQFPYPVRDLRGQILIDGNVITISDVVGRGYSGDVSVDGVARTTEQGLEGIDLRIVADPVDLDGRLFACFQEPARKQIEQLQPRGTAQVKVALSKAGLENPLNYDVTVDLSDASLQHEQFPLPVRHVTGQLQIDRERIELKSLAGTMGAGSVELNGYMLRDGPSPCLDIRSKCHELTLGSDLVASLPEHLRRPLEQWGVTGTLSADAHWERRPTDPDRSLDASIDIDLQGVQIRHPQFPIPLQIQSGSAAIDGTELILRNVRAQGDGVELTIDGSVRATNEALAAELDMEATVEANNPTIYNAAPWRLRKLLGNVQPNGMIKLQGGHLQWSDRANQSTPDWNLTGVLESEGFGIQSGIALENLRARVPFAAKVSDGVFSFDGKLTAPQVKIAGFEFQDISGQVVYDPTQQRWSMTDLEATLPGSKILGDLQAWTDAGETQYGGALTLDHVPLESLSGAMGGNNAGPEKKRIAGTVIGMVSFSGVVGDPTQRRAGGTFQVKEAELYKLPAMLAVLNVINLTLPKESAFQEVDTEFFLSGDRLQFRNLHLKGNALAMVGEGEMDWPTKALDLRLTAVSPKQGAKIPVFTELLEGASREVIEVRVTGPMDEPIATARPFRTVSNALETLIQPKKDK